MRLGGVGDFANEDYEIRCNVEDFFNLASTRFSLLPRNAIGYALSPHSAAKWKEMERFPEAFSWALTEPKLYKPVCLCHFESISDPEQDRERSMR